MPGKKTTPDQSTQVVILREAGYTLPVIADRLDLSISTVQRIIKTTKAVAGAGTQALIDKAREELLSSAFSLDAVQQTVATLVPEGKPTFISSALRREAKRWHAGKLDGLTVPELRAGAPSSIY